MQEVDSKVFTWDLEPTFASMGYGGVFNKKGGQVSEGLVCLFNKEKFRLVASRSYIVAEELPTNPLLSDVWSAVQRNELLAKRVLDRTTCLQLTVLETVDKSKRLVVANTHLYFHPDADHIRLLQVTTGLRLAHDWHRQNVNQMPETSLLFCGDFNSCPGYGIYELMTLQSIKEDYPAWASSKQSHFFLFRKEPTTVNKSLIIHRALLLIALPRFRTSCARPVG